MKILRYVFFLPVAAFFAGCTLPAMIKMAKEQALTVNPNPLEVHNGLVEYKMTANLPVKMLKKGTAYTLNSFYKYGDKEMPMDPVAFKAEDYPSSDTKQPSVSKSFSFPYQPMYKQGTLEIEGVASKGTKVKTTPRMKVATGLITTSMLVQHAHYVAYAAHGYNDQEELIPLVVPDFMFKQGRSVLQRSEVRSEKAKKLTAFIASKNKTKKVTITGTHSPEGREEINERLSQERAKAIEKYYRKQMDKYDYEDMAKSVQFTLRPVFENWEAFKKALSTYEGISADEKSAYMNIINNGKTFVAQEKEMKKLPSYRKVFREVYPDLRAAKTQILTVKEKKTPAEIAALAQQVVIKKVNMDTLSFEEMMYAASLTPSLEEKERIYIIATKKKTSAAAHNNLGAVYLSMAIANPSTKNNMVKKASAQMELAAKVEDTPEVNANLATIALMQSNPQKALEYAKKSLYQANEEVALGVNGVKGAAEIYAAKYSDAIRSESGAEPTAVNFFNQGLAQLLTKDYSNAAASLGKALGKDADFALAHYTMAIVAARTDDAESMTRSLSQAVKIDPNLKAKALTDLEFSKWAAMDSFTAVMK